MKSRPQLLNLVCRTPGTTKPVAFFVRCTVLAYRKPDPQSPYCFIDLSFTGEIPFVLKEILVTWFVASDEAEVFWNQLGDQGLSKETIARVFTHPYIELLKNGVTADRLKIVFLSPKRIRFFGEFEGVLPEKGEVIDLEARNEENSCLIRGSCTEFTPFDEAPGFAFVSIEPQLNVCLAMQIKRAIGAKGRR